LHLETHGGKVTWIALGHNNPEAQNAGQLLRGTVVVRNNKIQSLTVSLQPMPDGK
jgi:hypothetical protein